SSVTDIEWDAFDGCASLTSVTIPASITYIGGYAVSGCEMLGGVYFRGDAPFYGSDDSPFDNTPDVTVYRLAGKKGWPDVPNPWWGRPTALWSEVLSVTPGTHAVAREAGTLTFSVVKMEPGTILSWTAAVISGGAWARITSGASGGDAGTITVGFDANLPGGAQRTATIRVSAPDVPGSPVDVTVVQDENPGGGFLCDPSGDAALTATGTYDGYLYADRAFGDEAWPTVVGTLNVKLSKLDGRLTAKATLQAGRVSFSGKQRIERDEDGTHYSMLTARSGERLDLFVRQNRIWGTLAGGTFGTDEVFLEGARNRFADRRDAAAQAVLNRYKGYYTACLAGAEFIQGELNAAPRGYGYLTLTVSNGGKVKIAGVLADGTKVSQSAPLLYFADCGEWLCVPLFVPLYRKAGYVGGLFWIDPETREVYCGAETGESVRWENPGKGPDGFSGLLDMRGGAYDRPPVLQTRYAFGAELDDDICAYHAAGEAWGCEFWPDEVPVDVTGSRMTIARGDRPVRIREDGETWYEYGGVNPNMVTLSFTARTGIFKGNFTLYYDYTDERDRFQHKTVRVPYVGVMLQDPETGWLESGHGHCLFPSKDPELRAYRIQPSFPVELRGQGIDPQ
ncbi:MAG TPA: leucine-rich repeat protein, partial [Kiritimatiellia bacterium]|nr:leucine-rich repeat protein [Kiritimatiellia bacterium]